ncbi:MAG TPA: HD domain-containing phosphohydrolase [Gemmatimonadales bacterium]|nr:HD domain-containing phosphohydrolase [Gemmatimonadales bacterium]
MPSRAPGGPVTVLIVDDDPVSLELVKRLVVEAEPCVTMGFTDASQAVEWCAHHEPDLVITDCRMAGLDGLGLIRALRRRDQFRDVPIMMITGSSEREVRYEALEAGATDYLTKPVDPIEVKARTRNMLAWRRAQKVIAERARTLADEVREATSVIRERERDVIFRLSKAAESRDWQTGSHIIRIASYCKIIASHVGLSIAEQEAIHLAAPLHDIGKLGIPDHILTKQGELTRDEFAIMKQHPVIGHQILEGSSSELVQLAATISLTHHERYDGSGYPAGLRGDEIPVAGRIVAVADVFDALMSPRPYKLAWSFEGTIRYISLAKECLFDPACVAAFEAGLTEIEETWRMLADDGATGNSALRPTRAASA